MAIKVYSLVLERIDKERSVSPNFAKRPTTSLNKSLNRSLTPTNTSHTQSSKSVHSKKRVTNEPKK